MALLEFPPGSELTLDCSFEAPTAELEAGATVEWRKDGQKIASSSSEGGATLTLSGGDNRKNAIFNYKKSIYIGRMRNIILGL